MKPPPALAFAIKFIVLFALLMGAFEASRGTAFERVLVENCILVPTAYLINAIDPEEHVQLVGRTLSSTDSHLRVTRGCEGVETFLMLVAAILAYPAGAMRRARGLLVGSVLTYALAVSRLMVLHYILRYSPAAWEALHGLILPLAPIVLIGLFFMRWSADARQAGHIPPELDAA